MLISVSSAASEDSDEAMLCINASNKLCNKLKTYMNSLQEEHLYHMPPLVHLYLDEHTNNSCVLTNGSAYRGW